MINTSVKKTTIEIQDLPFNNYFYNKSSLIATWQTIEGKLVCRWVAIKN